MNVRLLSRIKERNRGAGGIFRLLEGPSARALSTISPPLVDFCGGLPDPASSGTMLFPAAGRARTPWHGAGTSANLCHRGKEVFVPATSRSPSFALHPPPHDNPQHCSWPAGSRLSFLLPFSSSTSYLSLLSSVKMAIWDTLTGHKSSNQPEAFDPSTAQDVSSFLGGNALPDPSELHPLAGLNQETLDYLTLEESALDELPGSQSVLPSRGWSDDLCYGTGTTYITALTIGGAWGLAEGLNRTPATAPPKLRLNSVLNSITRRGPFLGNSAGVVAMIYNGINSSLGYARGKHDAANSILAGALSGMLFKSTRGVKPMMISGGIVASIAGLWAVRISFPFSMWDCAC